MDIKKVMHILGEETFIDLLRYTMKIWNGGVKYERIVRRMGNSGGIYIPEQFVGQTVEIVVIPKDPEIMALRKLQHETELDLRKQKRKSILIKKKLEAQKIEEVDQGDLSEPKKKGSSGPLESEDSY